MNAALAIVFLAVPALALALARRYAWASKLGTIVLCYLAGLLVANLGLLPPGAAPVQKLMSEATIALALPMILFTVDVRAWSRIAGKAVLSMALATASIVAVAVALFAVYRGLGATAPHELAGLAVGVYTGGTPNLAAIKAALGVPDARYLLFNAFDTVVSAAYLMFMLSAAAPLLGRWLPAAAAPARPGAAAGAGDGGAVPGAGPGAGGAPAPRADVDTHDEDYAPLLTRRGVWRVLQSLAVAVLVVGLSVGLGQAVGGTDATAVVVALLATLGLAASFVPPVRRLAESYKAGMYLIYVFSFAVASMARLDTVQWSDMGLFAFVAAAVFASLALHALLCRFAGVDVDTFMVTSVSAICSPGFVPLVARSLRDRAMLASGIGTGVIGYAIGTQLGIAVALLLRGLG
jgi:uncharacterized membrane protein